MARQPFLSPVIEAAIRLATRAHRNQRRKGSDLPYIAHPAAVVSILERAGFANENVLAAAWLHDVVEDTAVSLTEIRASFPREVAEIVDSMSEEKTDAGGRRLSWTHRKAHHLARMKEASVESKAVMLADKLHNLTSIRIDSEREVDVWDRFNASRADLLRYYGDMVAVAAGIAQLDELCAQCQQALQELSDS